MGAHISALVVEKLVVDAQNASILINGGPDAMQLLARVVGGDQVLATILDPLHRPVEAARRRAN